MRVFKEVIAFKMVIEKYLIRKKEFILLIV
jgi:hypothetical protein